MEEKRNNPQGETCDRKACRLGGFGPFFVGLAVALVFGWWLFPELMFKSQQQPIPFNHEVHIRDASLNCTQCHTLRADGTFAGFPTTKDCAVCHAQMLGKSDAEREFIDEYVKTGKEVKWLVYARQPDNVFFSHAAHSLANCNVCHADYTEKELCGFCHLPVLEAKAPPTFEENRLSGYSKNIMKMWQCEACHANPSHLGITNASNACFVCHK